MEGKNCRKTSRLTAAALSRGLRAGKYYDGRNNGLDFESYGNGRGCWGIRIMVDGHRHHFPGGGYPRVSLKKARRLADKIKRRLLKGKPPFPEKHLRPKTPTLEEASRAAREAKRGPLSEDREARSWKSSIERYVPEHLRNKLVSDIVSRDIVSILEPLWDSKRPTANRLRTYLRRTMAWAIAQNHRADNPAGDVLDGALDSKGYTVQHHASHHYSEVAAAVARFRQSSCTSEIRLLYELLAHLALRSGELRQLRWDEIDWEQLFLYIPADRVKLRHDFVVPMSTYVAKLFEHARRTFRDSDFVFPGKCPDKPFSEAALPHALQRVNLGAVPHGVRASFRTWAAEQAIREPVAEACIGHGPKDMVGKAYIRTTFFDERREVMERWSRYLVETEASSSDDRARLPWHVRDQE